MQLYTSKLTVGFPRCVKERAYFFRFSALLTIWSDSKLIYPQRAR